MHACRVHFEAALMFSGGVFPTNGTHYHTFDLEGCATVFCLGGAGDSHTILHPYISVLTAREHFSRARVFRGPVVKCTSLGKERVTINHARFVASEVISRFAVSLNAVFCLQACHDDFRHVNCWDR